MTDYKMIFDEVESTLIRVGGQNVRERTIRSRLDEFKEVETKTFTDADYYDILVSVPFYSGFRASVVNQKIDTIRKHFPDFDSVAGYDEPRILAILSDPKMIRHEHKIRGCVANARVYRDLVGEYGSFQSYVDVYSPRTSFDGLMRLRRDLRRRFKYLGRTTSYHFLTEVGMPVLKPDRVVRRIFCRLGVIESEGDSEAQLLEVVKQGQAFAQATGHPVRYVDIVFVSYGREGLTRTGDIGIRQGICLKDDPRCDICGVREHCRYDADRHNPAPASGSGR